MFDACVQVPKNIEEMSDIPKLELQIFVVILCGCCELNFGL